MNGSFYQNPTFPTLNNEDDIEEELIVQSDMSLWQILNVNKGKRVSVYTSFNNENKTLTGILEAGTTEYLILSNPQNGHWDIINSCNIVHINFEEKIGL